MDPISSKLLAIAFSLFLLVQAVALRRFLGTFVFPAAIFSLCWFIFTIVPLVTLITVPVQPLALLYITLCTAAFTSGSVVFPWREAFKQNRKNAARYPSNFDTRFMRGTLYFAACMSVALSTLGMIINGFDLASIVFGLLETSSQYAALRGQEDIEYGVVGIFGIFFTYIAPVLGGLILFSNSRSRGRAILWSATLGPAAYYMLTQSAKLTLLVAIALLIASLLLVRILKHDLTFDGPRTVRRLLVAAAVLGPAVFVSFSTREGYSDFSNTSDAASLLAYAFRSYAYGEIYAFSDFFSWYIGIQSNETYNVEHYTLGYYTFKSVFDTLGGSRIFPPGYYDESFGHAGIFETNIFTIFRMLMQDFGIFGTLIFLFCFSLTIHLSYYLMLVHRPAYGTSSVFVVTVVFCIISYLFSIFTARYIFLLALGLYLILELNGRIYRTPRPVDVAQRRPV